MGYRRMDLLFAGNHLPWIFTLVHVFTGRNLYDVFHVPGELVHWQDDFLRQVLRCSIFVTTMEFITGIIVNKWFALHVWDYSCMPFQLFGQICLPFVILFACLCAVGIYLSANILHLLYGEDKPQFVRKTILLNSKYKCYNEM